MSKFTIILLIVIAIAIAIGVGIYFMTRPKNNSQSQSQSQSQPKSKSKVQQLIDNAIGVFGIKTSDNFTNDVIFNNQSDVIRNMSKFSEYAFPELDKNEVNKILNDNGISKTMDDIFEEHKNDSYDDFNEKFNILSLMQIYSHIIIINDNADDYLRLIIIVFVFLENLLMKKDITLPVEVELSQTPQNFVTLTEIDMELSADFRINKDVILYLRTNLNENIDVKDAIDINDTVQTETETEPEIYNDCYTIKLCKNTLNLDDSFLKYQEIVLDNLEDVKIYCYLNFASSLFALNGTTFPEDLANELNELVNKLLPTGFFD
jgi:hypothetical protein